MAVNITLGAFEAKTKFSEILEKASKGEEITITRHEKPVAKLIPYNKQTPSQTEKLIERLNEFAIKFKGKKKGSSSKNYKELINAGRKR